MSVYGEVPRPRVLFEDVPDEIYESMADLAPTALRLSSVDEAHDSDWDVLVTFAPRVTDRSEELHVLSFGAEELTPAYIERFGPGSPAQHLTLSASSLARTSSINESIPKEERRLLSRLVIPNIDTTGEKSVWRARYLNAISVSSARSPMVPWVAIGVEESVYAFEWGEVDGRGLWWVLPSKIAGHREWLRLLLIRLQAIDPAAVPANPDWRQDQNWAPVALRAALSDLERVQTERDAAALEFDRRESEAQARIDLELAEAAEGEHRLLTSADDALVREVVKAFEMIGFEVAEMDGTHVPKNTAALEDLRLTQPGIDDWVCLVEVKGLAGGPKAREIGQVVGRPVRQFILDERREPEKVALVVNQFRNDPPGSRPEPAVRSPDRDLAPLTDLSGVFIDTRDLFRSLQDIAAQPQMRDEVRRSIVSTVGVWAWPPTEHPEPDGGV